ncbi:unnamed protein product [Musa acuminata subsp. burmannicoides]
MRRLRTWNERTSLMGSLRPLVLDLLAILMEDYMVALKVKASSIGSFASFCAPIDLVQCWM